MTESYHALSQPSCKANKDVPAMVLTTMGARFALLDYRSIDYRAFLEPWLQTIDANGGYRELRRDFADYNVPYLYILVVVSYLPKPMFTIKAVSIFFDFTLAYFTFRVLALRYASPTIPTLGACVVLSLPSIMANGAMWRFDLLSVRPRRTLLSAAG